MEQVKDQNIINQKNKINHKNHHHHQNHHLNLSVGFSSLGCEKKKMPTTDHT
jgi:hypothetical protein